MNDDQLRDTLAFAVDVASRAGRATLATAVSFKSVLGLPPALGMMLGLGYLQMYAYLLQWIGRRRNDDNIALDSFREMRRMEWDTLLFFYGVVMCVGGLGFMGYLSLLSETLYGGWDPVWANVVLGLISAVVDNIPVMFAVLSMAPDMSEGNWLLITLTAGVGGSLLSMGSAAGVALMGQARGIYTFAVHLRWVPAILLGYVASIAAHLMINASMF